MGYDELSQFYYRYKVNACKIKLFLINKSTTEQTRVALYADNVSGSVSTMDAAMQTTGAKWCYLNSRDSSNSTRVMKNYV